MNKKKLIAILTLVCFMFTLVPVAAMAEEGTSTIISADTTWSEAKNLTANLTVNDGVTLTIGAQVTISGNVTISGGGTIKRATNYEGVLLCVGNSAGLTLQNITVDGGAVWGSDANDENYSTTLGYVVPTAANSSIQSGNSLVKIETGGTATLNNGCILQNNFHVGSNNSGGVGGAIYVSKGSTVTMNMGSQIQRIVSGCVVYVQGAGADDNCNQGKLAMIGGKIIYNYGMREGEYSGAAVRIEGSISMRSGAEISNNYTKDGYGAGLWISTTNNVADVSVDITGGTISNNEAKYGGGLYISYIRHDAGATFDNVTFANNKAEKGSAIYSTSDARLKNCEITGNTAQNNSGALYQTGSASILTLDGTMFSGNTSGSVTLATLDSANAETSIVWLGNTTINSNRKSSEINWETSESTDSAKIGRMYVYSDQKIDNWEYGATTNITFCVLNGGKDGVTKDSLGLDIGTGGVPTREGATFKGWFTDSSYNTECQKETHNQKYLPIRNSTCYAAWEMPITFDANGGILSSDNSGQMNVIDGKAIGTLPTAPTRENYTFQGWYTDKTAGTKVDENTLATGNATYYARWKGEEYALNFDLNGGSGTTPQALTMEFGTSAVLPTTVENSAAGVKLAGWATDKDSTVAQYVGNIMLTAPNDDKALTLYAVWTDKEVLSLNVTKQSYVYDGDVQAYILDGYTISYQQNGLAVSPINAGAYDVLISRAEDDNYAAYSNTFEGALEITKATPTITLTASETDVKGAKTITLTTAASVPGTVTLDAPADLTVTDKGNGVYEVALPNSTANYTFTAKLDAGTNYNEVSDDVTVTVTRKSSSTSNDSGATASKPQATVTTPNKEVTVTKKAVSNTVINKAEREVASDKDVQVIGGTISAVNITAKENGTIMTSFTEPLTVTVPVSKTAMNDVDDVSKLTLAKVTTDAKGNVEITYVGGSYDTQKGTFTALVDEPGDYILVENANIQKIELQIGSADYAVNGNEATNDTAPMNYNNRTLVAIRYIAEIFGAEVGWDPQTYTVTIKIDGKVLTMVIDEQIPGFDTPAILHNNRTMVPLRYISEAVGAKVIYVPSTQGIIVVK